MTRLTLVAVCMLVGSPARAAEPTSPMTVGQAVALGVVEGITEYLPVSSTGHLLLMERVLGLGGPTGGAAEAYAICIQGGAILAVLGLYRRRVGQMARGLVGRDRDGLRLLVNLLVAFVPAGLAGFLLDHWLERTLFGLWPVAVAWLIGGVGLLVFARKKGGWQSGRDLEAIDTRVAFLIGVGQCLALWPGTSRSLVTIVGGALAGLSLGAALEFSFLLGVVTLGAATAYKALHQGALIVSTFGWAVPLVGVVTATIAAALAVRWLVGYLGRGGMAPFGWYRIALSAGTMAWLMS